MEKKTYIIPQTAVHTVYVEQAMMGASETLTKNRNTVPSGDGKGDKDEGDNDEGEDQYLAW